MLNETIKNELLGWKKWEIIWLVLTSILITGVSIYISDKPLGIITALFGILCVICTGKGKLSAYVFGLLHAITYSIIAFQSKYYGEVMLNLIYYLPMQLYGLYIWTKNMNPNTNEVYKKSLNLKYTIIMLIVVAFLTLVFLIMNESIVKSIYKRLYLSYDWHSLLTYISISLNLFLDFLQIICFLSRALNNSSFFS